MAATAQAAQGRAPKEANATLHHLLEHRKVTLGLGAGERLVPEQFFPVDTRLLVRLLGWTLEEVSMVGHTLWGSKLAAKCIRSEKKIVLLSTLSEEVKRYTLAHELAHVLLHKDTPDCDGGIPNSRPRILSQTERVREGQISQIEREAEVYARELLMPERAVRRHFRELFGVARLLASSHRAAQFAPRGHSTADPERRSVKLREAATEIAKHSNPPVLSLTDFFGVSSMSMASRLIGLYLVY